MYFDSWKKGIVVEKVKKNLFSELTRWTEFINTNAKKDGETES